MVAVALSQLAVPMLSRGYLRKRRARGGYQPRYFVIDVACGCLRYYPDERSAQSGDGGGIQLEELCAVFAETPAKHQGRRIKLIGSHRSWTLLAATRSDALGWARALALARERAMIAASSTAHDGAHGIHALGARVTFLRAEHERLTRHAKALRELKARDAMVVCL